MRVIPLLLIVGVSSAWGQTSTPTPVVEDYFPLTLGSKWIYRVSGQDDRMEVRAVRQEMVGEQTCILLEASVKDKVVGSEHVAFTRNGLCRFRIDKEDLDPPLPFLRMPMGRNTSWKSTFKLGLRGGSATFQATLGETEIPLGRFKTINVQADVSESPGRWTRTQISYAEGVGMIRQVIEEGKRPGLTLELEEFLPAKK